MLWKKKKTLTKITRLACCFFLHLSLNSLELATPHVHSFSFSVLRAVCSFISLAYLSVIYTAPGASIASKLTGEKRVDFFFSCCSLHGKSLGLSNDEVQCRAHKRKLVNEQTQRKRPHNSNQHGRSQHQH